MSVESGKCPKCGSENLDYEGKMERGVSGNAVYYPFTCSDCGFEGREWYTLTFDGFTDDDGNEITEDD